MRQCHWGYISKASRGLKEERGHYFFVVLCIYNSLMCKYRICFTILCCFNSFKGYFKRIYKGKTVTCICYYGESISKPLSSFDIKIQLPCHPSYRLWQVTWLVYQITAWISPKMTHALCHLIDRCIIMCRRPLPWSSVPVHPQKHIDTTNMNASHMSWGFQWAKYNVAGWCWTFGICSVAR